MDNDAKLIDSAEIEELQDRIEALEVIRRWMPACSTAT